MATTICTRLIMKSNISKKNLKEFGLLVGFGLPILIGLVIPAISGHSFRIWTLFIGLPLIFLAILMPNSLLYFYKAWMRLGDILGWFNSRLILGLVFIVVLQPIALIMKIMGHDPLRLKRMDQKSYKVSKKDLQIDLKKIF